MKRIVLVFGLISGVISAGLMSIIMPLVKRGIVNLDNGVVVGYTAIVLSFVLVFFGIRAYRDQNGGAISFGRAFAVGILITVISCLFYVAAWEVMYYQFMPDFVEWYSRAAVQKLRAEGASDAAIAAQQKELLQLKAIYRNPLSIAAITFLEPFPVGLVVTLVSAAILRRRESAAPPRTATTALA